MVNDLESSRWARERFEPWFFMYDTGNPVPYSGLGLRELLSRTVEQLDPEQRDACLRQMVVIGHSQGGLLTKLTAVDSGDRLWSAISRKPFAELSISAQTRDLLQRGLFVRPLPFVRRVVFISTPHRGSYQALRKVAHWVTRFVRLPQRMAALGGDIARLQRDGVLVGGAVRRLPTSIDNMTEGNPFLMTLADIPVAPGIGAHSIIPVLDNDPLEEGKDGVVAYRSAHLDGVDSEKVIYPSGHSTQAEPATIEEVRRILEVHARSVATAGVHCGSDAASPRAESQPGSPAVLPGDPQRVEVGAGALVDTRGRVELDGVVATHGQ
jgi:pimeloyl-ACP methyl ester carboxylesterase